MAQAVQQALDYGCAHADGVRLCVQQLGQPEPQLTRLDLDNHPHLQDLGNQRVNLEDYNQLLGGAACP